MVKKPAQNLKKYPKTRKADPAQALLFDFSGSTKAVEKTIPAGKRIRKDTALIIPVISDKTPPADKTAKKVGRKRRTAEEMARKQRDISIAEFFRKNRHLLGFDNPTKALLTTVKEAVDNSLDACEEAGILPELLVNVEKISEDRFSISVLDNGPGIVKSQVPKIFGKLLYGSKFHSFKMSRGQQGIGISAAGMYGQMTTGKPTRVTTRVQGSRDGAHYYEILINAKKNKPEIMRDDVIEWAQENGTQVEIEMEARHTGGARSIEEYLKQTAIANPHVTITYNPPNGSEIQHFERVTETLPPEPQEIKPHPHGIEFGVLMEMMHASKARNLSQFFRSQFSRVSEKVAGEICDKAGIKAKTRPSRISRVDADKLFRAIKEVKIMAPPSNCISPIGEDLVLKGLEKEIKADFYTTVTRPPRVYRGNPFQIEAGLAYGGNVPADGLGKIIRFANRVPLQYQQSACAAYKSVLQTDWRHYRLSQSKGALPSGPLVILVHMASVWVPFTSESKEAVANYPEIMKEMKLALQVCGRRLGVHLSRRRREAEEQRKRSHIDLYIPHIGEALKEIIGFSAKEEEKTIEYLRGILERSRKP